MKELVKKMSVYGNDSIRYYNEAEEHHCLARTAAAVQMIGEEIV